MRRLRLAERADWRTQAEACGFVHHSPHGQPYWDESLYYAFSLRQIEDDIEAASMELHAMAMDMVDRIIGREDLLQSLAIPASHRDWIATSWRQRDPSLYGRLDLAYDGSGPVKLYELNYDTPTSLFEAAWFQWGWLEDQRSARHLPASADQFNSLHEALIARFGTLRESLAQPLYFTALAGWPEDQATVAYLRDCAIQAGLDTRAIDLQQIGQTRDGRCTDLEDTIIRSLFKLYPLEDMIRDRYGQDLPRSGLQLIEPPWKAVLSNKGLLPLLWQYYPGHPLLLEARFDDGRHAVPAGWVRKPLHSREGANIEIHAGDGRQWQSSGPYAGPWIIQRYHPLPDFDGGRPVLGSWMIDDQPCGLGIREDDQPITGNLARFVPHAIID
ncbi:glutathionylspermidine synthase family protein [Frateuria aurantia]|uniref:Glutathionylspermidine synthase n=1 Tax=Frateuria aurantia (strain ATCC 33424 / DSM 6220 / KCTC 2777 / LMG 1558 / NBRC 3245 / NCIMB 13370) TaxID=767434 RepID=H8L3W1_FRAAD|nr:glutathionylspermidine synthase family protein [Frateuria aurantia]AFC84916.1 glutathionylspermidine synthase [Frateuria aurantia DSM 6220]